MGNPKSQLDIPLPSETFSARNLLELLAKGDLWKTHKQFKLFPRILFGLHKVIVRPY